MGHFVYEMRFIIKIITQIVEKISCGYKIHRWNEARESFGIPKNFRRVFLSTNRFKKTTNKLKSPELIYYINYSVLWSKPRTAAMIFFFRISRKLWRPLTCRGSKMEFAGNWRKIGLSSRVNFEVNNRIDGTEPRKSDPALCSLVNPVKLFYFLHKNLIFCSKHLLWMKILDEPFYWHCSRSNIRIVGILGSYTIILLSSTSLHRCSINQLECVRHTCPCRQNTHLKITCRFACAPKICPRTFHIEIWELCSNSWQSAPSTFMLIRVNRCGKCLTQTFRNEPGRAWSIIGTNEWRWQVKITSLSPFIDRK